jgi:hypothetical protein
VEGLAAALGAVSGGVGMFAPSMLDTKHTDPHDPVHRHDLYTGMALASIWSLVIVGSVASASKSAKPFLWWGAGMLAVVGLYEYMLHDARTVEDA